MINVLEKIKQSVLRRVEEMKRVFPFKRLLDDVALSRQPEDFKTAFKTPGINIIAEIKLASPSEGTICKDLSPEKIAVDYINHGAKALSVITEQDHFNGRPKYINDIRKILPHTPILMKDFVIDEYQIALARHLGADAVLLIVALLGESSLSSMMDFAKTLGLSTLVEVHNEDELKIALRCGADIIGINNRNLKTMKVSLETSKKLVRHVPQGITLISESGIISRVQIDELKNLGFNGFLIGTTLMKTYCPGKALASLIGGKYEN